MLPDLVGLIVVRDSTVPRQAYIEREYCRDSSKKPRIVVGGSASFITSNSHSCRNSINSDLVLGVDGLAFWEIDGCKTSSPGCPAWYCSLSESCLLDFLYSSFCLAAVKFLLEKVVKSNETGEARTKWLTRGRETWKKKSGRERTSFCFFGLKGRHLDDTSLIAANAAGTNLSARHCAMVPLSHWSAPTAPKIKFLERHDFWGRKST